MHLSIQECNIVDLFNLLLQHLCRDATPHCEAPNRVSTTQFTLFPKFREFDPVGIRQLPEFALEKVRL